MLSATVREARLNLSKLLRVVEQGEEIVIRRRTQPIARLVPWSASRDEDDVPFPDLTAFRQRLLHEGHDATGRSTEELVREDRDKR